MKKTFLTILIALMGIINTWGAKANSTPMSFLQPDGTTITVVLHGDEHTAWYTSLDGAFLSRHNNAFYVADINEGMIVSSNILAHDAAQRKQVELTAIANQNRQAFFSILDNSIQQSHQKKIGIGESAPPYVQHNGSPKVLVVLAEYEDQPFSVDEPQQTFQKFFNSEEAFADNGHGEHKNYCSIREYFKMMSYGSYTPDFQVVGPVKVGNMDLYGGTNDTPNDENYLQLINDAVTGSLDKVNLSDFDNDGDGAADIVYIVFSGYGQNSGGDNNTIWARTGALNKTYGDTRISWFSLASELNLYPAYYQSKGCEPWINGIGVVCHEFSHALGYPDVYPTSSAARVDNQEMEYWDLMDAGEYVGNGYCPKDFTAWEREVAGWMTIDNLAENASDVTLQPILDGGKAYKFCNPADENEYFVLENIQKRDLNKSFPGHGLIVYHVKYPYDSVYLSGCPNNTPGKPGMAIVPADGAILSAYTNHTATEYRNSHKGDPFPGENGVTELNSLQQLPNYCWYTGEEKVAQALYNINEADDGSITFSYTTDYDLISDIKVPFSNNTKKMFFDIQGRRLSGADNIPANTLYINNGKKHIK